MQNIAVEAIARVIQQSGLLSPREVALLNSRLRQARHSAGEFASSVIRLIGIISVITASPCLRKTLHRHQLRRLTFGSSSLPSQKIEIAEIIACQRCSSTCCDEAAGPVEGVLVLEG